jgi:hypothetical protein
MIVSNNEKLVDCVGHHATCKFYGIAQKFVVLRERYFYNLKERIPDVQYSDGNIFFFLGSFYSDFGIRMSAFACRFLLPTNMRTGS